MTEELPYPSGGELKWSRKELTTERLQNAFLSLSPAASGSVAHAWLYQNHFQSVPESITKLRNLKTLCCRTQEWLERPVSALTKLEGLYLQ